MQPDWLDRADSIGFDPNELEKLTGMLADYLNGNSNSDRFWLTDDDDGPVGVAYCAFEPMTYLASTLNI